MSAFHLRWTITPFLVHCIIIRSVAGGASKNADVPERVVPAINVAVVFMQSCLRILGENLGPAVTADRQPLLPTIIVDSLSSLAIALLSSAVRNLRQVVRIY
jgi:hypothetical protein